MARERPRLVPGATERRLDRAAGTLLLATAAALGPSCGSDTPSEPTALDVRVADVPRLPAGCPDQTNACYPMCVHGAAPAAQLVVPLWQADSIRLAQAGTGRYEGTLRPCRRTRSSACTPRTSECAASTPATTLPCSRTSS